MNLAVIKRLHQISIFYMYFMSRQSLLYKKKSIAWSRQAPFSVNAFGPKFATDLRFDKDLQNRRSSSNLRSSEKETIGKRSDYFKLLVSLFKTFSTLQCTVPVGTRKIAQITSTKCQKVIFSVLWNKRNCYWKWKLS